MLLGIKINRKSVMLILVGIVIGAIAISIPAWKAIVQSQARTNYQLLNATLEMHQAKRLNQKMELEYAKTEFLKAYGSVVMQKPKTALLSQEINGEIFAYVANHEEKSPATFSYNQLVKQQNAIGELKEKIALIKKEMQRIASQFSIRDEHLQIAQK